MAVPTTPAVSNMISCFPLRSTCLASSHAGSLIVADDFIVLTHANSGDIIPGAIVSIVELTTGILAACLPTYGPLVHRTMGRKTKTSGGGPDFNYATRVPSEQSYELMSDRNATYKRAHIVEASVAG